MNKQVDVMAVMDAEIERAGFDAFQSGRNLIRVRAAVADLVEAAKKVIDEAAMDPRITDTSATWIAVAGMRSVIAKFGGAQ